MVRLSFIVAVIFCLTLPAVAETVPVRPLALAPGAIADATFIDGEFSTLKPGAALGNWEVRNGHGALTAVKDADGKTSTVLEATLPAKPTDEARVGYDKTVRVDVGYRYQIHLRYRTALKGLHVQVNYYGFSTWGDTITADRIPVPPTGTAMRSLDASFTVVPGAICVGIWLAAPPQTTGELTLSCFDMTGSPWGGQVYPPVSPSSEDAATQSHWEIVESVINSVPVNSVYFGPGARTPFPVTRGRGTGAPWIPAGAVVPPSSGQYTVGVEVRQLGGCALIERCAGTVTNNDDGHFVPQRLTFPDLQQSCRIDLAAFDGNHHLVGQRSVDLWFQSHGDALVTTGWDHLPAERDPWPGAGIVGIHIDGDVVRDFVPHEKVTGTVTISSPAPGGELQIAVERYDRKVEFQTQKEVLTLPARVMFSFEPSQADVYDITATYTDAKKNVLDRRTLRLGLRETHWQRPLTQPDFPDMFLVEEQAFSSARFAPAVQQLYPEYLQNLKSHGSNTAGIGVPLSEFNPMPGVYRFAELQHRVELAQQGGVRSFLYLQFHGRGWPDWAVHEHPLDQNGEPDESIIATVASPAMREVVRDAYTQLAGYFRGDPSVIGFGQWNAHFDWTYHDGRSNNETANPFYDYSASALNLWRQFSGGEAPPKPLDKGPDLRPVWRQWTAFRGHLIHLWKIDTFAEPVRAEAPRRWLVTYMMAGGHADMESLWADFKRLHIYPAHGGADSRDLQKHLELTRQYGIAYRHESVSAPSRHPLQTDLVIYHSLFGGLPKGWAYGYNVAWNVGWPPVHSQPGVVSALSRRKNWLPLIQWMQEQGFDREAHEWAQYESWDDMLLGARNYQWFALGASLDFGNMFENINHDAVSDRTPAANWQKYKLIFCYQPSIVTAESAATIRHYIEQGGVFVLVLRPGPGMALLAKDLLDVDTTNPPTWSNRVTATGEKPWFTPGRKLVIADAYRYTSPTVAVPIAVADASGREPVAWACPLGRGTVIAFAGAPDLQRSTGFLADMLAHVGIHRSFCLAVPGDPDQAYPPEGLLFRNGGNTSVLWIHRAIRWNKHSAMIAKANASGVPPTMDGFAKVFSRTEVQAFLTPPAPGNYSAAVWQDGKWMPVTDWKSDASQPVRLNLAPGEIGVVKFTRQ